MGLTIHYSLHHPAKSSKGAAIAMEKLRQAALLLPFETVSDLLHFTGAEADFEKSRDDDEYSWLKCQSRYFVQDGCGYRPIPPLEIIAFSAWPGDGCEQANFGLCKYPNHAKVPRSWNWKSFCKTQYAYNISSEHFVKCHLSVVTLLRMAIKIGFKIDVDDEGGYWGTHNKNLLTENIDDSSKFLAAFAGKLKDAFPNQTVCTPITGHPRFEHLEFSGQKLIDSKQQGGLTTTGE